MRAMSWVCGSSIARGTRNSEIVKPMPDSAAPPAIRVIPSPGASTPLPAIRIIAVAPVMPMNLPTTSPATMPQATGEVAASRIISGSRCTPAFASANTGRTP